VIVLTHAVTPHVHHPTKESSCVVMDGVGQTKVHDKCLGDASYRLPHGRCRIETTTESDGVINGDDVVRCTRLHITGMEEH
jgi:hypothetical protein